MFSAAASLNACVATCLCWCQWVLLAPRTKEENVEARGRSFAGKSMMQMGKSMSQMPSFLFRPQKAGGAMQQARVAPAPRPAPAVAMATALPHTSAKKPPKPGKRSVGKWCRLRDARAACPAGPTGLSASVVMPSLSSLWCACVVTVLAARPIIGGGQTVEESDTEMLARAARLAQR